MLSNVVQKHIVTIFRKITVKYHQWFGSSQMVDGAKVTWKAFLLGLLTLMLPIIWDTSWGHQPKVYMLHFSVFSCVADQPDCLMLCRGNHNYSVLKQMCILVTFSATVREYLDKNNLREKVFILAHSSDLGHHGRKFWQQEIESQSTHSWEVENKKWCAQLASSFLCSPGSKGRSNLLLWWNAPPQLIQLR